MGGIGKIEVLFKFDGGVSKTDGLFDLDIDYYVEHAVGRGVEQGSLNMFHHNEGNNWVSHLEAGRSQIDVVTTFSDSHFRVDVDGTLLGEQISGSVESQKGLQGYSRIKIDLSKGLRKLLQFDAKVKADRDKMEYSSKIVYSVLAGAKQGTVMMKLENKEFTFSHIDKNTREKVDLRVFLNHDGNLRVDVDGTLLGEQISGNAQSEKGPRGYRIKIDLSKGLRKLFQFDAKVKADRDKMEYSSKIVYSVMAGAKQGTVMMKLENKEFTFSHFDKNNREKVDLRVFLNHDGNLRVDVDGTLLGEQISGNAQSEKGPRGYRIKIDLSKGLRKL